MPLSIEERVGRLERQNCRLRWVVALALVLVVALGVEAARGYFWPVGRIQAKSFVVVDREGKQRAIVGTELNDNVVGLRLFDRKGKLRAGLTTSGGTPALVLMDQNERPRMGMDVTEERASLLLRDPNGKTRVDLGMTRNQAGLDVFDKDGQRSLAVGTNKSGPKLMVNDAKGKTVWVAP